MSVLDETSGAGRKSAIVPGLRMVRSYRIGWLPHDVVAGLVLTTLLVPQGMAYAELAGLPAITGLYTSILCLLGYAAFGPSRILVLGPDSSLGPIAKLGFVADLLSKPTTIGYMNGLAITILIGQLPKLFGFSTDASGLVAETRAFVKGVSNGDTVTAA